VGVSEKFTVPFDTAAGEYSLFVVADHDHQVEESNEDNNYAFAPLSVLKVCVDDIEEPNNQPQWAPDVAGGLISGLQVCPYDLDWYKLELFAGEKVTVTAFFANAEGDLDLRLYGADNAFVPVVKAFQTNDGEVLSYTAMSDGIYYIRVNGLSGAANAYDLDILIEPGT